MEILPDSVGRLAMIARWKPVHLGHSRILRALADYAEEVVIGIGSSNKFDADNPFTPAETREMLALIVPDLCVIEVPDLGHGPRWRAMVVELLGPLDMFVTANGYVRELLRHDYRVVHPVHLLDPEQRVAVNGTMVREAIRAGEAWEHLVEPCVAEYLRSRGLVERVRRGPL